MGLLSLRQGLNTFNGAEFSLTEDEAGEKSFFHFDSHNLPALHQTIQNGEFIEPESPDHPYFLKQAERLRSGEQDWFVGALYYPHFSPDLAFCNASVRGGAPRSSCLPRAVLPYYGVIFLREECPPLPEGADALGGTVIPTFVWHAVFLHSCRCSQWQMAMKNFEEEMRGFHGTNPEI